MSNKLWTPAAWLHNRWQENVLLEIDSAGHWQAITPNIPQPPDARATNGPILPPLVNAHSHAFQRAMAGGAETRDSESDDFWSWREAMYAVALSISPEELKRVATRLYRELLRGGYTQVCEFHYLQHQPDGQPYADELTMAWALVEAAQEVGIGITMLPVLYAHQGFGSKGLKDTQRRFKTDADWVFNAQRRINSQRSSTVNAGVALHSLRAAHPEDITALMKQIGDQDLPIHIHVAEQTGEVRDCLGHTGLRPIEWLCKQQGLDARWQLVHATHAEAEEIELIARQGAGVVICPTTEANLGDGLAPLTGYLDAGVPLTVGSDSEVGREWREELRWLEYGQRLVKRQRNVASQPGRQPSSAARLFDAMLAGSGRAAGFAAWGLQTGARADWLVLDLTTEGLEGVPPARWLDALVFASAGPLWAEIGVAGRPVSQR